MSSYYKECFVEQIYYFDALDDKVWKKLVPSTEVFLSLDKTDSKLRDNIMVKFKIRVDDKSIEGILGVINKDDSKSMLPFLEAERDDVFSAKICSKTDKETEDRQIRIVVYIVSKG